MREKAKSLVLFAIVDKEKPAIDYFELYLKRDIEGITLKENEKIIQVLVTEDK